MKGLALIPSSNIVYLLGIKALIHCFSDCKSLCIRSCQLGAKYCPKFSPNMVKWTQIWMSVCNTRSKSLQKAASLSPQLALIAPVWTAGVKENSWLKLMIKTWHKLTVVADCKYRLNCLMQRLFYSIEGWISIKNQKSATENEIGQQITQRVNWK